MFCKNCGTNLPDDAKFCAACGTVIQAEVVVPVQPVSGYVLKQPNPLMTNFLSVLKGFWTKPIATVGTAVKSNTHEWFFLALIGIVSYALGTAVVGIEMMSQLLKSILGPLSGSLNIGEAYPFFAILGIGVLVGAAAYFGIASGLWVLVAKIFKKSASFISVLNMTAVACLPLTITHILNMLIGLVFSPLTVIFFVAALAMTVICLYTGMQKLDKLEKSPFYGFSLVLAIVILVVYLLGMLYFSTVVNGIKSFAASALSGALGSVLGGIGNITSIF